ncbi:MAG: hypothetical protein U0T07_09490 [Chitinophagales bacterium]
MKQKFNIIIITTFALVSLSFKGDIYYDPSLVKISTTTYNSDKFTIISMRRNGNHIKAKYFAATDPYTNKTVSERYKSWSMGKSIVAYSSGTYMTACEQYNNPKPVGLCIDNGEVVNKNLDTDLGGLVIVYATGGLVATRLNDDNLILQTSSGNKVFNIKNNLFDRAQFITWSKENEVSVFQAHLLVYKDSLDIKECKSGSCLNKVSRRFLVVCKDKNDKIIHSIVNCETNITLYDGTKKAYNFLKEFEDMKEILFMINLESGCNNVFKLYKADGSEKKINSSYYNNLLSINNAGNLLVYYYE